MDKYCVWYKMHEIFWYRFDVEAENEKEAKKKADQRFCDGEDPDREVYDCTEGPSAVEVEKQ